MEGGTSIVSSITSSLQVVADQIVEVLAAVAPVALVVAGAFLAWRYGMKFFKAISK